MMHARIFAIHVENSLRNIIYILQFSQTKHKGITTICIDPTLSAPVLDFLQTSKEGGGLQTICNTHYHFDHVAGNVDLLQHYPEIEIFGPQKKCPQGTHGLQQGDGLFLDVSGCICLQKSEERKGKETEQPLPLPLLEVFESPGHCDEHIGFSTTSATSSRAGTASSSPMALASGGPRPSPHQSRVYYFAGDTLTFGGVGNCHDSTGSVADLFSSIQKLCLHFSDETLLCCAHDYILQNLDFSLQIVPENENIRACLETLRKESEDFRRTFLQNYTLGQDKKLNLFLMLDDPILRKQLDLVSATDFEVFCKLRALRDRY